MQIACSTVGITPEKIGLAEIYGAYAGAQLQELHALGLSKNLVADLANEALIMQLGQVVLFFDVCWEQIVTQR